MSKRNWIDVKGTLETDGIKIVEDISKLGIIEKGDIVGIKAANVSSGEVYDVHERQGFTPYYTIKPKNPVYSGPIGEEFNLKIT